MPDEEDDGSEDDDNGEDIYAPYLGYFFTSLRRSGIFPGYSDVEGVLPVEQLRPASPVCESLRISMSLTIAQNIFTQGTPRYSRPGKAEFQSFDTLR